MTTLFISDLHLDASRPHITDLFEAFVRDQAASAGALYILGDLFEAWTGDDTGDPTAQRFVDALAPLREARIPCFYLHGNRDFLLGDAYARRAGMTLLADPSVLEIEGVPTLVMHGDTLCTDDLPYQAFRTQAHSPAWQRAFLSRPLAEREAFARQAREESRRHTGNAMAAIMDVSQEAVDATMRASGVRRLVHGHTHRPAVHRFGIDGAQAERIVLGDWYDQASVLTVTREGIDLAWSTRHAH
ncbi:UDP-2,3-diacylglucosamine diphosphatase [Dokdonella sp. MW10]|uniref:UDP-2,3-diacylglucosamine diphosphatase n=1 Tax=Dokdonella sp. MW10 TaxID=2992926 RepID=UPI003F7EA3A9